MSKFSGGGGIAPAVHQAVQTAPVAAHPGGFTGGIQNLVATHPALGPTPTQAQIDSLPVPNPPAQPFTGVPSLFNQAPRQQQFQTPFFGNLLPQATGFLG